MKKTLRNIIKVTINEGVSMTESKRVGDPGEGLRGVEGIGEISPKDIVERLSKAVSLKEWEIIEDVLKDLLAEGWQHQWSLDTLTMSAAEKDEIERWRDHKR